MQSVLDDICCYYQIRTYMVYGHRNGISPEEYIDKITDFTNTGKILRHIKASFEF